MNDLTKWFGVVARLVVGGVWIIAGSLKIGDPAENVRAVRAYDLLPEGLVQLVGHALPMVEIVVGVCLVLGLVTRWVAVLSAIMLIAFIIGISTAWARGLEIECGCFGGGGGPAKGASSKYPWELARDAGLLLLSAYLIWRPRTPLSVDERLLPAVPAAPATGATAARAGSRQQAAEIRRAAAAQEQRRRNQSVTVVVLVALLAIVGVGYAVQSNRDATGQVAGAPSGTVDGYAMPVGSTKAKVVVDVYEDFMCPFCGQFEAGSRSYVDKTAGAKVLFRYHIIAFLDRASSTDYSSRASNALAVVLDTAGPQVAKKFHDELYARQPAEGSAGLSDTELVKLAVAAGATQSEVEKPIKDREFAAWVRNATDASSKAGVNQTPTVLVGGQPVGGQTINDMVVTMENMIQKAEAQ